MAFRADASLQIGTGHVMRCLTLAGTLRQAGCDCMFLTRELQGHLADRIESHEFHVVRLPVPEPGYETSSGPAHAAWAGVPWQTDATECQAAVAAFQPDWIVLDHYAFDRDWEASVLSGSAARLLVIDDLADRPHLASILLDQNLGRSRDDYTALLPIDCTILTGPRFALLRTEFGRSRKASMERRQHASTVRNILISMGGIDLPNATGFVLESLQDCALEKGTKIDVVLGKNAPNLETVRATARAMRWPVEIHMEIDNMAEILAVADFAIGAAGSSTWERCSMGVPSLIAVLADNQKDIAQAVEQTGAAIAFDPFCRRSILDAVCRMLQPGAIVEIAKQSARITDGLGSTLVAETILGVRNDY